MLKHVQTMSSVLRTLGVDVNLVFSGGREQIGVNENCIAMWMHFSRTVRSEWVFERNNSRSNVRL